MFLPLGAFPSHIHNDGSDDPRRGGAASSLGIANQTRREDTLQELFRVPYLPLDMQAAEAPGGGETCVRELCGKGETEVK